MTRISFKTFLIIVSLAAILLSQVTVPANVQAQSRQLILEKIEIVGNKKTSETVIYEHLSIRPGDAIDPFILDMNRRALEQSNFFKSVDFSSRPGSQKGNIIIVIEVEERKWPYFQFEGGHADLAGWYFVPASLRFDNLFGGGNLLSLRWFVGDEINRLILNFRLNSLFSRTAYLDFDLHTTNQRFIHYISDIKTTQNVEYGGMRVRINGKKGWSRHTILGYRAETYQPDDFIRIDYNGAEIPADLLPPSVSDYLTETRIRAFTLDLTTDSRDNKIYPRRGFWGAATGMISGDGFGSEVNFSKLTADARFFAPVSKYNVLALHLKAGTASDATPFYERFFLGGANSLRGYGARRLTPVGWGTKLLLSHTEFRFPLSSRGFPNHKASGAVFFDAGGIWLPDQQVKIEDFYASIGLGVRIRLPVIGLTRMDFAFPLNRIDENDFQFHLSLGHMF